MSIKAIRKRILFWIKVVISVSVLAILLFKLDLQRLLINFHAYKPFTVFTAFALLAFCLILSAFKWSLLLPNFPFFMLLKISFIRQFYSAVLLGQVSGDIVRIYKLGNKSPVNLSTITASVMVDRLTGLLSLFCVGTLGMFASHASLPTPLLGFTIAILFIGLFSIFFLRFRVVDSFIMTPLLDLLRQLCLPNNLQFHIITFFRAIRLYSENVLLLAIHIVIGSILQVSGVIVYVLLAKDLGISVAFADWCWISLVVTLLVFLPLSINGLGIRDGSLAAILGTFGVAPEQALVLSFSVFSLMLFLGMFGGIIDFTENIKA